MSTADERFFAWLDGELPAEEAARVAADVAANPELTRLAEQHRALRAQLRAAFDPVAEQPIPEQLSAALHEPRENVVDFASSTRSRDVRRWAPLPQWTAIAATLAIGIFVGTTLPRGGGSPVEVQGGKLMAAAALNRALDSELASVPKGETRIGLTFRDQTGAICRSFTNIRESGLACRDDGRWQVRGLFAAPEGQGDDYRMAAGMNPNLAALVDSTMAGEPFDAGQERAAKEHGWK